MQIRRNGNNNRMARGAPETTSYQEEVEAMKRALEWVSVQAAHNVTILIVTDSQSLCEALSSSNEELWEIQGLIDACCQELTIQWVPGHAGVEGNELADRHAKAATSLDEEPRKVAFNSAKSHIKRIIGEKMTLSPEVKEAYSSFSRVTEARIKSRADQVLLAQLRSGHHKAFGDYQLRLNPESDPTCSRCMEAADSVKHWLTECPATLESRTRLFGRHDVGLKALTEHPEKCVALAKQFGVTSC